MKKPLIFNLNKFLLIKSLFILLKEVYNASVGQMFSCAKNFVKLRKS